jgi:hypothetical protein
VTPLELAHDAARGFEGVVSFFTHPSLWRSFVFQIVNIAAIIAAIRVVRVGWKTNDGLAPLERLILLSIPVILFYLGMVMFENEQPESTIGAITVLVGMVTLLLVARQVSLAQNLEAISRHQTAILDRQDAMLSQRAQLKVSGKVQRRQNVTETTAQTWVELDVVNVGSRAANSATLQLLMSKLFDSNAMFGTPAGDQWRILPDEEGFFRWETDLDRLFFVDVPLLGAAFVAFNHPRKIENAAGLIKWRIAFFDGVVPGKGLWADLTLRDKISG